MTLEEKADQLAAMVQSLAASVAKYEERFDRIDKSIERLFQADERTSGYLLDFRREVAERFQVLENRQEIIGLTLSSIETRFAPLTKAILDFGSTASYLIREQSQQKDSLSDLTARVTRIEESASKPAA